MTAAKASPPRLRPSAAQRGTEALAEELLILQSQTGLKAIHPAPPSRSARGLRPVAQRPQSLAAGLKLEPSDLGAFSVPGKDLMLRLAVEGRPRTVRVACSGMVGDTSWVRVSAAESDEERISSTWKSAARVVGRTDGKVSFTLDAKKVELYLPRTEPRQRKQPSLLPTPAPASRS